MFAILLNIVGTVILQVQSNYGVTESAASILEAFKDLSIAIVSFFIAFYINRIGYKKYGNHHLANEIGARWIKLNETVFSKIGKLMEKYNVEDLCKLAGGGEYEGQDGFGWTNGVYQALKNAIKENI